jgi:type IV secretion system protein VirB5
MEETMTFTRKLAVPILAGAVLAASPAAHAQIAVIDSSNLAQALNTARNTLATLEEARAQVEEAQRAYDAINGLVDIESIAPDLANSAMRGGLPDGLQTAADYVGDPRAIQGVLGARVEEVFASYDFGTGSPSSEAFEDAGYAAARDVAVAEDGMERAILRAEGIQELGQRLNTASTAKEVGAVNARAAIEGAAAANETNRLLSIEAQRRAQAAAAWRASESRRSRENDENRERAIEDIYGADQ